MTTVRVWAPEANQVELECGGSRMPMDRRADGWWSLQTSRVVHGSDYAFRVDGNGPFPDPRSAWQPQGVHGPSRWLEHSRFVWNDAGWQAPPLAAAVIQEIHVGTFTPEGSFDGVIDRLDHLVDLGITHLELMPVAAFPGERGWGYDGVDLYAPHHAYGGPDGLKRLVDACHRRGIAVLLDVVYNHLGPDGNYLAQFGPYFTDHYQTPWGDAVNLDGPDSDSVRRFFIYNALMWLRDYHLDGLRIDAVHAIVDTSATHFLEQLAAEVQRLGRALGRHLVVIAENDRNDPRVARPVEAGGYGLDAQWNEDFHHALHALLTRESDGYYADFGRLADVARALTRGLVYDGRYSHYRRRTHGRPASDLPGRRFIGCLQNHDQVGNRALGDRISEGVSPGLLKIGAALVMTSPFVPMLFQGEEWAAATPFLYFTDHTDTDLGRAVTEGRQREFAAFRRDTDAGSIPDPQSIETFEQSRLDWDELEREPHADILQWYRALIALRHAHSAFGDDRLEAIEAHFDEAARWLIVHRSGLRVVCNLHPAPQRLACPGAAAGHLLLQSDTGIVVGPDTLELPGESVVILDAPAPSCLPGQPSMSKE
ncbi:malto-oligosyltrehalose trehalohydrolase [Thioalkalivibrio sp. AKL12]|uniref:malto-oligosyltrehalose trehalohydrolase n=1 Tax=Thioalkalivibrio sp. AKL12 TaxID=1158159 RepID=UPI00037DAC34|nr:malto-oligosyltrehalose trehalohydrolase [Thioalkalivibrio sp. AKL12]